MVFHEIDLRYCSSGPLHTIKIGCFIILYALVWRFSLVDNAKYKMDQYDKTTSTAQRNQEKGMSTYDKIASTTQRTTEIEKAFFEIGLKESTKASAEAVARLNLTQIPSSVLTSKTELASVLRTQKKALNEVSREMLYNELLKENTNIMSI